jgi:hypothetical protein
MPITYQTFKKNIKSTGPFDPNKKELTVIPGTIASVTGILAKIPVDVQEYPVQNENGLPFKDNTIHSKDNKFVAQPKPEMYESWENVENLLTINEIEDLYTDPIKEEYKETYNQIYSLLKENHQFEFTEKYGKDSLKALLASANHITTLIEEYNSTLAKEAHEGKDIGKKGKNFNKIADEAAKKYGSKEVGERVAASIMWKMYGHKK